jgi:hypothetical protein
MLKGGYTSPRQQLYRRWNKLTTDYADENKKA